MPHGLTFGAEEFSIQALPHRGNQQQGKKSFADEKKDTILDMIEKFGNLIEGNERFFEKLTKSNILEERFAGHQFVKDVKKLLPGDMQERMFFYGSCNDFIQGNETGLSATIDAIYPASCKFRIAESFLDESNALLKADLLEFTKKGTLTDSILELTPPPRPRRCCSARTRSCSPRRPVEPT